eukprot:TRINITY_DN4661_c0_g1_i1.p1 TRINITY_DN4661_c0_g1~~TRINITY_DN4661_c0_g1_i1.p1  ORF type:complete len:400 (-),score=63.66 TRINITY_DN4661_c0_g1_i1:131-1183(-)
MAVASTAVAAEAMRRGYRASAAVWRRARRGWSARRLRLCGVRRNKFAVARTTGWPSTLPVVASCRPGRRGSACWHRRQPDSRLCRSWSRVWPPLRSKSMGDIAEYTVSRSPRQPLRRASTDKTGRQTAGETASSNTTSDISVTKLQRRRSPTHEGANISSDFKRRKLAHADAGNCTSEGSCAEQRVRRSPSRAVEEEDSPAKRARLTPSPVTVAAMAAAAAAAAAGTAAAAAAAATMAATVDKESCCGCGSNSTERCGGYDDHREGLRLELVDGGEPSQKRLRRARCIDDRPWDSAARREAILLDLRQLYPVLTARPILEEAASESADMEAALEKVISWLSRRLEPQQQS